MNLQKYCLIYIGYLIGYGFRDPVILCISDDKLKVKYYLKNVRRLEKRDYEIREVTLDYETAMSLYEDYVLQEYEEDCLYLTNLDIFYLNKEIESTISRLEKSYDSMKDYCNTISKVPKLREDLDILLRSLKTMENELSKVKTLKRICNAELKESSIFSPNILVYLKNMNYLQEDKEMTEIFYRKVSDENE